MKILKVALFTTCLGELFYVDILKDTTELLERLGCDVEVPEGQICCGQPAYNTGYKKETIGPARQMIQAFSEADYVVSPSGSCTAMLQEYEHIFSDDPNWADRARNIAAKTYELTSFIVNVLGVVDVGAVFNARATLHTSCHMTRLLGERNSHYKLLSHVRGLQMIPLANNYDCCGFGGTFSIKISAISEQMVNEKIRHIEETKADVLIGADASCLMHIGGRLRRLGKPIRVMHIVQILNSRQSGGHEEYVNESRKSSIR